MRKVILVASLLCTTLFGCLSNISPEVDIQFIAFNKSMKKVSWVKVFSQDTEKGTGKSIGLPVELASFNEIFSGDSTFIKAVDLRDKSKTGHGKIIVWALKLESSDTLKASPVGYDDYQPVFFDSLPYDWRTMKITLAEPTDSVYGEFHIYYGKYKLAKRPN